MSILSTLAGALEGAANRNNTDLNPAGAAAPGGLGAGVSAGMVISQIIGMIQSRPGGLGGLLQSFQQGGLGHLVQSWIGTGQNLPVSVDQVRDTLGSNWISRIGQATGLPEGEVEQQLSSVLPQIVDHLSPDGQLPQGDLGAQLTTLAQRLLHR
jgi:uncharacterized protein YidB (DUF937 family)